MALRILQSPAPGYLSPVAMRARDGSGYPPLPLHGATCWLCVSFISLANVTGDIPAFNERATNNEEKGDCAHAYIYERTYMLIFSLEFPTSGLGFQQHPRGPLSEPPTKRVGIWAWYVFVEARAWTLVSTTHTDLSLRDTPKPGVPRVCLIAFMCVHAFILITGVYGCLLRGLSPARLSSKT